MLASRHARNAPNFSLGLLSALLAGAAAQAQTSAGEPLAAETNIPAVAEISGGLSIPALTPVLVRFEEEVSSEKNHRGDRVRISIAADVVVDGHVAIPAGSAGEAEVIHVVPITTGGQPGELTLAARFVRVGDQVVRLRSLEATGSGKDRVGSAKAVGAVAAGLVSPLLSVIGASIKGGARVIPVNTVASAKTATALQSSAAPGAASPVETHAPPAQ